MANSLIPTDTNNIPAHVLARMGKSSLAADLSGGLASGESFPRISIKGGRFRVVEDGNEVVIPSTTLDVIIVGANPKLSKTWYEKAWDPNDEPSGPDCYSLNGTSPHPDSPRPQNDLCSTCPHNAWGSKTSASGAKIKACADQKRLAVVAADDPGGTIYLLQITPAALKNFGAFQKELQMRGFAPETIKTTIGFDTDASFPKLTFKFGGWVADEDMSTLDKVFGSQPVLDITGVAVHTPLPVAPPAAKPVGVTVASAPPEPESLASPSLPPKVAKGFGKGANVVEMTKPAAAKKPKEVEPEVKVVSDGASLADEIANMLEGMTPDDDTPASA